MRSKLERVPKPVIGCLLALSLAGCTGVHVTPPQQGSAEPQTSANVLTSADVQSIVQAAAASVNVPLAIAVSDRSGNVLAVYLKANAPVTSLANFGQMQPSDQIAVALARSAAFFSNDQAPISTRTVRYISASHFPPGIAGTESGPLYGIENTNRGCGFGVTYLPGQSLPIPTALGGGPSLGILTGKPDVLDSNNLAVNPGGVPIFKNNEVAGAIGVTGADPATDEFAAYAGTFGNGFVPTDIPSPGEVVVNGVALPFVQQTTRPAGESAGAADGSFEFGPIASPGPTPEGDLIAETGSTQGGLTLADVQSIIQNTLATANQTRAVLRLPIGSRTRFAISIADLDGHLLALYRMPDATMFSTDVAVAKARNVIYFSSAPNELAPLPQGTAVTNRTIGFAAQPFFPSGIDGSQPGPFFDLFQYDLANPCTQGHQAANPYRNGIVFFPGAVPLYKGNQLVGGLGVSGDGVDQDDFAAAAGGVGFTPPANIRADNYSIRGVPLPYQKFPRDPEE
ncbi:MAG TPA: heme-binding protein [Terriglobales bacterium]